MQKQMYIEHRVLQQNTAPCILQILLRYTIVIYVKL